jgi:ABC-type proline/glycine betaine transport system substrate-binding protein
MEAEKRVLQKLQAAKIEGQPDKPEGRIWGCPDCVADMIRSRNVGPLAYAG